MLLISGAAACFVAWAVLVLREIGFAPFQDVRRTFRNHSRHGKAVLGFVFCGLFMLCATKPQAGGGDGGGGTNNIQMVNGSGSGLKPLDSPGTVTESPNQGLTGDIQPTHGGASGGAAPVADVWTGFTPITSPNTERTLVGDDFRRGFVLTRIGTDEAFGFDAPAGASVCADWLAFGAAEDWLYLALDSWAASLGTNEVSRFRAFSFGRADPLPPATNRWFAPFGTSLGIVPQANWPLLAETGRPSRFWHCVTPSDTLVMTWQNVLLERDTNTPVSVQMELWPSGRFTYRYDLSRLGIDEVTNILVGASLGGLAWTTNAIPTNVTSLAFWPLTAEDAADTDRDGDGLSLADELFVHGTDPGLRDTDFDGISDGDEVAAGINPHTRDSDCDGLVDGSDPDPAVQTSLADLDGDGIPDAYENFWFGGTNVFNTATNRDETGFTLDGKILGGVNPTNGAAAATIASTNGLVSWKLFDGFAADWPSGATNLVWERTFAINRSSAWQQFFVSASPTNAAGWRLDGMALEWEDSERESGTLTSSPFGDSAYLPLSTNNPSELTLRLRATSSPIRCARPLHLLAYAPIIGMEGKDRIEIEGVGSAYVYTDGSASEISVTADRSARPCKAPLYPQESDPARWSELVNDGDDGFISCLGRGDSGRIAVARPGDYTLSQIEVGVLGAMPMRVPRKGRRGGGGCHLLILDPHVSYGPHGCGDAVWFDWSTGGYSVTNGYPLEVKCLRSGWTRISTGEAVCDCSPNVSTGLGFDCPYVTTETEESGESCTGTVKVGGRAVWSGMAEHDVNHDCDDSSDGPDGDGCGCSEACQDGNCDVYEGTGLGLFRFRLPVGAPRKGQLDGFVYLNAEDPVILSFDMFTYMFRPDASVTVTTNAASHRIVSHGGRGRDILIEGTQDGGVLITVRTAATGTLEHTWRFDYVPDAQFGIRARKISRLGNPLWDKTYIYEEGAWDWTTRTFSGGGWAEERDNLRGTVEEMTVEDALNDPVWRMRTEYRTIRDLCGNILSMSERRQELFGECDRAELRETHFSETDGSDVRWRSADWWNDPATQRHGKLRFMSGSGRPWRYCDWDELGHEILRVEQRNGSPVPEAFPAAVSNELTGVAGVSDAIATVFGYGPLLGDSSHAHDRRRPRCETRYLICDGVAIPISRTWHRYVHLTHDGIPAVKEETWRAAGESALASSAPGAASAYSYRITFDEHAEGVPLVARGETAEELDVDGVLAVTALSVSGGAVTLVTRRFGPVASPSTATGEHPTYAVRELDATYGTLLRTATCLAASGAPIEEARHVYDAKNRLRTTTYLDGTSLTNAYSCCRLLWKRDREGRKVLRSAQTGTDHLYNATEDVWLGDVSTNGQYRVTQHFCDALGRETNTVVYAGTTPGEAVTPTEGARSYASVVSTAYPFADFMSYGSVIRTDERETVTATTRTYDIHGSRETVTETVSTNGATTLSTATTTVLNGPATVRREWAGGWTEERRFTDYAADGKRIEYVVTESHDCGTVTNSISTYDLLDRLVSVATPTGTTSILSAEGWNVTLNAYDGTSSRILSSTYTAGDIERTTSYLYNDFGEQVGTALDGVTNRTDVTYAEILNEWWRVETSSVIGPHTNSLTITKTQLTGLSDSCRRHEVTMVGRAAPGAPQTVTETTASFDPATGIETETVTSSIAPTIVRRSLYGVLISEETVGSTTVNAYDAFGRAAATSRSIGEAALSPLQTFTYSSCGDLIATHTYTNSTDILTETYAYDMLGNRIATTDALGNTVYRAYDPFGNVIAEYGATYPIRYTYDTQNRRTSLSTTRDGVTWDETRWAYDPPTGNCLSKTYADGSTVTYAYTPDNLPLRTTYASGKWRENAYDERRQVVAVEYSDGETVSLAYDAFLNEIAFSNDVASANLDRDAKGNCTNDTAAVGNEVKTSRRTFDEFSRLTGIDGTIYDYNADGLLASISNDIALVEYAYTPDGLDAGYSLTLSNGVVFTRSLLHDGYRRSLVTGISSVANGVGVGSLAYTYDALNRPTSRNNDTFGYNARSEVTAANVSGVPSAYGYDEIGNSTNWTANCLNQYAEFTHDADGNMTQCGDWTYTYDAANRLKTISSNGVLLVTNFYDAKSRRVKKVTLEATTTFFYDGWNLIEERIAYINGTTSTIRYYWGKDMSGTLQGAGGVGGLLYLTVDGVTFIPCYDNNGNITRYLDANGNTVAQYTYDAFGGTLSQSGILVGTFHFRFSTKYCDRESGLYYYGYRFYSPSLMRWLNRDPIEEEGGVNVYSFCKNNGIVNYDTDGRAFFAVRRLKIGSFNVPMGNVYAQGGGFLDRHNIQILHEQLFFQDDNQPISVGFGSKDVTGESFDGYVATLGGYNDCVMRKATEQIKFSGHNYAAFWFMGHIRKCNCQDYCSALRNKYNELIKDKNVRCECGLK